MVKVMWLLTAVGVALGIVCDMRRLKVNRVGTSRLVWVIASACTGPFAGATYLVLRRAIWRTLIEAVWRAVGDASQPRHVRRVRLLELRRCGLVGEPVYRACLRTLASDHPSTTA